MIFRTLIKDLAVGKDRACLFLKGAAKLIISDDFFESLGYPVIYTRIIERPLFSVPGSYLDWLCMLGGMKGPLDSHLMSLKPSYPGVAEPTSRRQLPNPEPIAEHPLPLHCMAMLSLDTSEELQANVRNAVQLTYDMIKAARPDLSDQRIFRMILDKGMSFNLE